MFHCNATMLRRCRVDCFAGCAVRPCGTSCKYVMRKAFAAISDWAMPLVVMVQLDPLVVRCFNLLYYLPSAWFPGFAPSESWLRRNVRASPTPGLRPWMVLRLLRGMRVGAACDGIGIVGKGLGVLGFAPDWLRARMGGRGRGFIAGQDKTDLRCVHVFSRGIQPASLRFELFFCYRCASISTPPHISSVSPTTPGAARRSVQRPQRIGFSKLVVSWNHQTDAPISATQTGMYKM